jgi:hypothetical protein
MEQMRHWATSIVSFWLSANIKLEGAAALSEISEMEIGIGMRFPISFVELYKIANGFKDWDMNEHMISIWPLDRIKEEYTQNKDKNFVGFCDYLINSHHIGFLKNSPGIFKEYDEFNPIASTFEEAIELINSGSDLIF